MEAIEELVLQPCTSSLYVRPFRLCYRQVSGAGRRRLAPRCRPDPSLMAALARHSAAAGRRGPTPLVAARRGGRPKEKGRLARGLLCCPATLPSPSAILGQRRCLRRSLWLMAPSRPARPGTAPGAAALPLPGGEGWSRGTLKVARDAGACAGHCLRVCHQPLHGRSVPPGACCLTRFGAVLTPFCLNPVLFGSSLSRAPLDLGLALLLIISR